MRRLLPFFALTALACSASHTDCDAPLRCYSGWSGSRSCCLRGTLTTACGECPSGTFEESACGRIDAVCEGVDAGPREDGGGCGGPFPFCYQGWSSRPDCCLEPGDRTAMCIGGDWRCPPGTFLFEECGRIDAFCEGPIDAGPGPGLYDDCTRTSDCTLVADSCCGVCGRPQAEDLAAVNETRTEDYYYDVACPTARDEPPICPGCASQLNPYLVATCDMRGFRPVCAVVDLETSEFGACGSDADCVLAAAECCACGEIDPYATIAVRGDADLNAVLCDGETPCPPCVPVFDPRATARCDAGQCTVDLAP